MHKFRCCVYMYCQGTIIKVRFYHDYSLTYNHVPLQSQTSTAVQINHINPHHSNTLAYMDNLKHTYLPGLGLVAHMLLPHIIHYCFILLESIIPSKKTI